MRCVGLLLVAGGRGSLRRGNRALSSQIIAHTSLMISSRLPAANDGGQAQLSFYLASFAVDRYANEV
jgi:hypothetical protein